MQYLKLNMLRIGVEEGKRFVQIHVGSMKNMQSGLAQLDQALFVQKFLEHPDERCPTP